MEFQSNLNLWLTHLKWDISCKKILVTNFFGKTQTLAPAELRLPRKVGPLWGVRLCPLRSPGPPGPRSVPSLPHLPGPPRHRSAGFLTCTQQLEDRRTGKYGNKANYQLTHFHFHSFVMGCQQATISLKMLYDFQKASFPLKHCFVTSAAPGNHLGNFL